MSRSPERQRLVRWVATEITPYEPAVRAWLTRSAVSREDSDDLIQEAYCHIAELDGVDHIARPAAFFFQVVRNLLFTQLRRSQVVSIESAADMDSFLAIDEAPTAERVVDGRREYERIRRAIDELPDRCRTIFELRKIEGLPQREIAERLGVTETIVENDSARGLRLILEAIREQGDQIAEHYMALRKKRTGQ